MNLSSLIQSMQDNGLTSDQIVAILKRCEQKSSAAIRQQRYRDNERERNALRNVTPKEKAPFFPPSNGFPDPSLNSPLISPQKKGVSIRAHKAYSPEFEEFWELYPPNSGSKAKAYESWQKAINTGVEHERISGRAKEYRDWIQRTGSDIQHTAHAATWLNQARWEVNYAGLDLAGRPARPHDGNSQSQGRIGNRQSKTEQLDAITERVLEKFGAGKAEAANDYGGPGRLAPGGANAQAMLPVP